MWFASPCSNRLNVSRPCSTLSSARIRTAGSTSSSACPSTRRRDETPHAGAETAVLHFPRWLPRWLLRTGSSLRASDVMVTSASTRSQSCIWSLAFAGRHRPAVRKKEGSVHPIIILSLEASPGALRLGSKQPFAPQANLALGAA